jgi:hypothetical protein
MAEIQHEAGIRADSLDGMVCTLTAEELQVEFYGGYGGHNGKSFTAWTDARVYFPVVYDGAEWVGSAPRNPCDEATEHQGGE